MKLQDHPAAAAFPMMDDAAFNELKDSIAQSGQRVPIVLLGGKILDGRNRYHACQQLKINPITREFDPAKDGQSVLLFVLDSNLRRRHLTPSQKAVIAAEALKALQAEAEAAAKEAKVSIATKVEAKKQKKPAKANKGTVQQEDLDLAGKDEEEEEPKDKEISVKALAKSAGVGETAIKQAKKLVNENPDLATDVKAGKKTIAQAKAEAKEAAAQADQKAKQKEILARIKKVCGPEFAQAFEDNTILKTASEAAEFLKLDDKTMADITGLIVSGWKVTRAVTFVTKEVTARTKVGDLINMAIANKGVYAVELSGFEIAVTKLDATK